MRTKSLFVFSLQADERRDSDSRTVIPRPGGLS